MVRQTHGKILTGMRVQQKSHSRNVSHEQRLVGVVLQSGYDVIKEKMCCGVSGVVEGRHGFSPTL
jgi:hypothetical protein